MSATVVRYTTHDPARAEENQALIERVFAQLAEEHPEGLRYLSVRLEDGVSFVHVALVDEDAVGDGPHPLTSLAAFKEFAGGVGERAVAPPVSTGGTVVGAYGFGAAATNERIG